MPDAQWFRIHSRLISCSGMRVGKETHCRLGVEALRMARMGALGAAYGKGSIAARPAGALKASGRA